MDLRQLVIVSKEQDSVVSSLCSLFNLKVAFNDPEIIHFGLENSLMTVGRSFLEVISPVQDGTTAERFIKRRGGEGGYMIIIQVDNLNESKKLVVQNEVNVVWESSHSEAQAIHLHPKDMGGAILSLDQMNPPNSWKWAGTDWEETIDSSVVDTIKGVQIQSANPASMKQKWERVLGVKNDGNKILLDSTWLEFIEDNDGRGEGIHSFNIKVKDSELVMKKAEELNLVKGNQIIIGGVIFTLS
jgi:hypothetical protein|tara:strand:+ start:1137 stop:1865 length:729 start_codon:yes stop_codon:yes gene_type:complete